MIYNQLNLCSAALLQIGSNSISSFQEDTSESEIAGNIYPIIRDGLLSSYPWSFAISQIRLGRINTDPVADFKYAYLLPTDFLRIISAGTGNSGNGIEYRICGNTLHTNSADVVLTYISRPKEESFPAFFAEALIAKLAAQFCLPLTENVQKTQFLSQRAKDEIAKARLTDAQQSTPKSFEDFTLVEARQ